MHRAGELKVCAEASPHREQTGALHRQLPAWFAPEQVRVITIGEDEPLLNYAKQIVNELRAHQVRATGNFGSDPMKVKIANALLRQFPQRTLCNTRSDAPRSFIRLGTLLLTPHRIYQ